MGGKPIAPASHACHSGIMVMTSTPLKAEKLKRGDLILLAGEPVLLQELRWDWSSPTGRESEVELFYGSPEVFSGQPTGSVRVKATSMVEVVAQNFWKFTDADRTHPLTAKRIAVVANPYPSWKYHVALVQDWSDSWGGPTGEPTEEEVAMLVAYLAYRLEYYTPSYRAVMAREALDVDSTVNTYVFHKDQEGGWRYRAASWRSGNTFWPSVFDEVKLSLEDLLDKINTVGEDVMPKWTAFKNAHGDVFRSGVK